MDPASHWLQLKNASVVCFLPVGCHTRCSILLHKKMIIRTRTCSTTYTTHTWQTRHVATKWLSDLLQWTYFCFSSVADKFTQTGAASFPKTNTHTHTHSHRHMNTHTHTLLGSRWVGWEESANIALPSTNKNSTATASVWCKRLRTTDEMVFNSQAILV